jgi:AmmeMemoRadiSam system protein B
MQVRRPIVAGQFYPGRRDACVDEINEYIDNIKPNESLPETIVSGIVPHAGWAFSGQLAVLVFSAVKQRHEKVDTFCIFGAAHSYFGPAPAVGDEAFWETPLGKAAVDRDLGGRLLDKKVVVSNSSAHRGEHSIEVQVPFIQYLFPDAQILPILTPPSEQAVMLGEAVGGLIKGDSNKKVVCIGSTDLTHYGPRYGFTPMGIGEDALDWADRVNDQRFIDLALRLEPERMLTSAAENCNACGAGAAAAAVATAKSLGKTKGLLLAHTNSNQVMLDRFGTSSADSVGYAAIVF